MRASGPAFEQVLFWVFSCAYDGRLYFDWTHFTVRDFVLLIQAHYTLYSVAIANFIC